MSGRAEAVDTKPRGVSRHHQRAPADQARAQQRRDRDIVTILAEREGIAGIGDGVRGETAIPCIAGEERTIAQIFHALLAEAADTAGVSKPRDADAVADLVRGNVWAEQFDTADDFVAGNYRIFDAGQLGVDDVKVGPAYAASAHLDANLSVAGK